MGGQDILFISLPQWLSSDMQMTTNCWLRCFLGLFSNEILLLMNTSLDCHLSPDGGLLESAPDQVLFAVLAISFLRSAPTSLGEGILVLLFILETFCSFLYHSFR